MKDDWRPNWDVNPTPRKDAELWLIFVRLRQDLTAAFRSLQDREVYTAFSCYGSNETHGHRKGPWETKQRNSRNENLQTMDSTPCVEKDVFREADLVTEALRLIDT